MAKGGGSDFSHKEEGVDKIGGCVVLKNRGIRVIFILTNPFQCYVSLSVWYVRVLFVYTISNSIICVALEEHSLIESNQHMY